MEQPTTEELARVREWFEWVRQNPAFTAPGATFSLGPAVSPMFADLPEGRVADEWGFLERCVALANVKPEELFGQVPEGADEEIQSARRAEVEWIQKRQALLIPLLAAVASDPEQAVAQFLPAVKKLLDTHVWSLPAFGGSGHHDIINDDTGLYAYAGKLLLEGGSGRDVRRCENCDRLFLVRPTLGRGRPQKRFCEDICQTAMHDSKSGERRRRARATRLLEGRYGRERSRGAVQRAMEAHPETTSTKKLAEHARALLQSARNHK
jgi:hypothetical protein